MKKLVATLIVALTIAATAGGAAAVTVPGNVDSTNAYPYVAMISFVTAEGRFRCTATQVTDTVLITAAHCTFDTLPGTKTIVTWEPVAPSPGTAPVNGYDGTNTPAGYVTATPHAHPDWANKLQLNALKDVGVVVLDAPNPHGPYPALPPEGYLDDLTSKELHENTFLLVGYGVYFEKGEHPAKPTSVSDRTRRWTTAPGSNVTRDTLVLHENENDSKDGGGTCFGDSGGPAFHDGFLVADTSFGGSQFCRSNGGYQRLDTPSARSFLDDYVPVP